MEPSCDFPIESFDSSIPELECPRPGFLSAEFYPGDALAVPSV